VIILCRIVPWIAALALGVLGWFAMVPIWTQGLGLVSPDADFQPALWLAAAKAMLLIWGGVIFLRTIAAFNREGRLGSFIRKVQVFGIGMYITVLVLYLVMCGQPLRMWFLIAHWDWGNPLCLGILGFVVCLTSFFCGPYRGIFEYVIIFPALGAFILMVLQLSPNLPVVHGGLITPSPQDWPVLAFALGCGAYVSWLWARRVSKRTELAAG